MRTAIFIIVILVIVGTGFYLKNKGIFFGDAKGEIAPTSEWQQILSGNWDYSYIEKGRDNDRDWIHKGVIEFKNDSSFILHVNIKRDVSANYEDDLMTGGDIIGIYLFKENALRMVPNKCNIKLAEPDDYHFVENDQYNQYCTFYNSLNFKSGYIDNKKMEVMQFNKENIIFKGKLITNDKDFIFRFHKLRE